MASYLLLHGFAQTPQSWQTIADDLRKQGHRVAVPALLRKNPAALASLEAACQWIAQLICEEAEAAGEPVVVVGYSMGGRLLAETLVRAEAELPLAAVVLESAGLGPASEEARTDLAERNAAWAQRVRTDDVEAFMDWWESLPLFASQQSLSAEIRAQVRAERTAQDPEVLAATFETWGAQHQTSEAETLQALKQLADQGIPIRYLAGALDRKYSALAARAAEVGLPATIIEFAGHNTHLEQPGLFVKAIS